MERNKWCRRSYHRSAKLSGILALCLAFLSACSAAHGLESDKQAADPVQQLKNVDVTKIAKNLIANLPEVSADLVPSVSLDVTAKTGGGVEQILKQRGDTVQVGDVLFKLSSTDAQFKREQANLSVKSVQNALARTRANEKSDLAQARQQLADLTKNYNKLKNDYDEGLATKSQLDQAEARLTDSKAALAQLKLSNGPANLEIQLRNAQISLQQADEALAALDVKAPISGFLTDLSVEPGMILGGNTKVGVIQKLDPIKMTAMITAENAKLVSGKKQLTYYIPETTIKGKGKISYLADVADPKTNLYELDLEVPNNEAILKLGMKVRIQLEDEQNLMAVTVPTYSIVREGADTYVFVLVNDVVEKRSVQLGRLNEPNQEVISGIKEGEMVVISGQNDLKDGEKIQLASVQTAQK